MDNPVADVAAQASAALALISRLLIRHGDPEEAALAGMRSTKILCPDALRSQLRFVKDSRIPFASGKV